MNSTFHQSHLFIYLKTLTTESLDKWSDIEDALRERKNVLKQEFRETKALEKALAKAEAKSKKDVEKALAKTKKDAEKADAKTKKDAEKADAKAKKEQEKADAKAQKDTEKTKKQEQDEYLKILQDIHGDTPKTKVKKSTQTKSSSYKNYSIWTNGIKGQDNAGSGAPTQKELDAYGGRREWKKIQWGILTKEQKDLPTAPWNSC
jgi:membrane protein involved in colicin uptake